MLVSGGGSLIVARGGVINTVTEHDLLGGVSEVLAHQLT